MNPKRLLRTWEAPTYPQHWQRLRLLVDVRDLRGSGVLLEWQK